MKLLRIATCCVLCTLVLAATSGCTSDATKGYTTRSPYPSGIRTVAVPIWTRGKDVYRRRLEMRLTEALVKRIEQDTRYKVTKKKRADTELTGTIVQVSQQVLTINPDDSLPRETEITLVVSFRWTDLRTGKAIVERENFRVTGTYLPSSPMSEDFFQGSEEAINKLAERIVEQLQSPW